MGRKCLLWIRRHREALRHKVIYGPSKKAVQDKLREIQGDASAGTIPDTGLLTFGSYIDRWLAGVKGSLRETSYDRYETLIRLHIKPSLGGVKLSKLTPFHIEQFYSELEAAGVGATTRKMCGMVLNKSLRRAARLKLISSSPAADVSKPRREQKEIQFLDDAQAHMFSGL